MTKTDLINAISEASGLSKVDARKALEGTLASITAALKKGDKITLPGFGAFAVGERAERQGKNPRTLETVTIPAKKVVKFKAGSDLDAAVQ